MQRWLHCIPCTVLTIAGQQSRWSPRSKMDVTSRGRNSEQGPAVMPSASFSKGRKEGRWRRLSESHSAESVRGRDCGGGRRRNLRQWWWWTVFVMKQARGGAARLCWVPLGQSSPKELARRAATQQYTGYGGAPRATGAVRRAATAVAAFDGQAYLID
jgi:hypothetical protein